MLLVISFLVWFDIPGSFIALAFFVALIVSWHVSKNAIDLMKVGKKFVKARTDYKENEAEDAGTSKALFLVQHYDRVTETTDRANYIFLGLEIVILFLFPLIVLFTINSITAICFIVIIGISGLRHYINAQVVIEETGNMDLVGGADENATWENKSRLSDIVDYISASKARGVWVTLLSICGLGFLAIFLGAVGSSTESERTESLGFLPNASYSAQTDDVRYPTCSISKLYEGFDLNATIADYTFLAGLAYNAPGEPTQASLDAWFGENIAVDRQDIVDDFREQYDEDDSPVVFKLTTFPTRGSAIISIRGTMNNWDMLADSQLWSAAALMQGIRAILPAGEIWTPILDRKYFLIASQRL